MISYATQKRILDIVGSFLGLIVFSPILLIVAIIIKLDSKGPVFFRQPRIGLGGQPFTMIKFRSMNHVPASEDQPQVTRSSDMRITRVGRVLRSTKLDEIPELFNVLKGEMSLVGYRPEVERYVRHFRPEWRPILETKPGITDVVTLQLPDEERLLEGMGDIEKIYIHVLMPIKMRIYLREAGYRWIRHDFRILYDTVKRITVERFGNKDINSASLAREIEEGIANFLNQADQAPA